MKKVLRVQPLYRPIVGIILFLLSCVFILLIAIFSIAITTTIIIGYIFCGALALYFFVMTIYFTQYAIVSEKGIELRMMAFPIFKLSWCNISKITVETLSAEIKGGIQYKWLVIYVKEKINNKNDIIAGYNRPKCPPYEIIATQNNIEVINKYFSIDIFKEK